MLNIYAALQFCAVKLCAMQQTYLDTNIHDTDRRGWLLLETCLTCIVSSNRTRASSNNTTNKLLTAATEYHGNHWQVAWNNHGHLKWDASQIPYMVMRIVC